MPTNRILTDRDRQAYRVEVDLMNMHCPEMMARKIQDAIVQQAFVLHTVIYDIATQFQKKHGRLPLVLSAGSWEDTAGETLKRLGYTVIDCDPMVNSDLHTFRLQGNGEYDVVISTSVLEHTEDWHQFIQDICGLLLPGGVAILTCDFKDDWSTGDRVPTTSNRFFTNNNLSKELKELLSCNNCYFVDEPDYTEQDRFSWENIFYSFATIVFKKAQESVSF